MAHWQAHRLPASRAQAQREDRLEVHIDESACHLLPHLTRTWAPRGQTPVLEPWDRYQHLSIVGAVSPTGESYFQFTSGSFTSTGVVAFLVSLLAITGRRLLVAWDNASIHRSQEIKDFLNTEAGKAIHLDALPASSPELKAAEQAWAYLKCERPKNVACKTMTELTERVTTTLHDLTACSDRVIGFFRHPDVGYIN